MTSREAYNFVLHELERNTNFTKDSTFGKAVDMLNDLVERDMPKRVQNIALTVMPPINIYKCECWQVVEKEQKYCSSCGQRLKWSDNE